MKYFKLEIEIAARDDSDFDEFIIDEFVKGLIEDTHTGLRVIKISAREE